MSLYAQMTPEQRLEALARLLDQPGWKLFIEIAEMTKGQALGAMMKVKTGDETMFHKGMYKAIDELVTWPLREAEVTRATLEVMQDQPK